MLLPIGDRMMPIYSRAYFTQSDGQVFFVPGPIALPFLVTLCGFWWDCECQVRHMDGRWITVDMTTLRRSPE